MNWEGDEMAKNNQSKKNNGNKNQSTRSRTNEPGTEITRREAQLLGTPITVMRRFSEEMDRLFEDFGFGHGWLAPGFERSLDRLGTLAGRGWTPQVEVLERNNRLIIRADLPGMTKDDIDVDIDQNSLVLRGERKSGHEENEEGYYRSERSYGSFYRRIPLPTGINAEDATAEFRNGVLEISMPASEKSERRTLEIKGETEPAHTKARAAGQK
jgi:HSP20 family protein